MRDVKKRASVVKISSRVQLFYIILKNIQPVKLDPLVGGYTKSTQKKNRAKKFQRSTLAWSINIFRLRVASSIFYNSIPQDNTHTHIVQTLSVLMGSSNVLSNLDENKDRTMLYPMEHELETSNYKFEVSIMKQRQVSRLRRPSGKDWYSYIHAQIIDQGTQRPMNKGFGTATARWHARPRINLASFVHHVSRRVASSRGMALARRWRMTLGRSFRFWTIARLEITRSRWSKATICWAI